MTRKLEFEAIVPCPLKDPQKVDDSRKTATIDLEQKTQRWHCGTGKQDILNSCLREVNYTFWQGLEPEEPGLHGVGFAIKNSLLGSVEPRSNASGIPIQWPVYLCRTCENLQVLYPNLIFSIRVKRRVL